MRSLDRDAVTKVDLPATHADVLKTDELQLVDTDVVVADAPSGIRIFLHGLLGHFL